MPCQEVFNKISLDRIPDELKDLKKLKKNIFQENILKNSNNAWKRGTEGSICNIPIETESMCNILPRLQIQTD